MKKYTDAPHQATFTGWAQRAGGKQVGNEMRREVARHGLPPNEGAADDLKQVSVYMQMHEALRGLEERARRARGVESAAAIGTRWSSE